jgi:hypothetical protein
MNKIPLLLILLTMIFTGCQVAYIRPPSGDMAGDFNVYQGFSRSAVGAQNTVDAASTKTSAILTADISPELNSEINPELNSAYDLDLSSEINPALASEINPSISGNSAEINPEIATELSPELEVSDLSDVATGGAAATEEEPISTTDETVE